MKKILFLLLIVFIGCKPLKITTETKSVFKDTTITIYDTVKIYHTVTILDTNIIETEKFIYKSYIDTINKIPQIVSTVHQKPFEVKMKVEHKHTLTTKEKVKKKKSYFFTGFISGILLISIIVWIIVLKLK